MRMFGLNIVVLAAVSLAMASEPLNKRDFSLPSEQINVELWTDSVSQQTHYRIYQQGKVVAEKQLNPTIQLRFDTFDPLQRAPVDVPSRFQSRAQNQLFIVQFHTQPLLPYRQKLTQLGGIIHKFLPNNAYVVRMTASSKSAIEALPFVRWVGAYHPAYRLDEFMLNHADDAESYYPRLKYNIMIWENSLLAKEKVAKKILKTGGTIDRSHAGKYLIEATLTPDQLFEVVHFNEIQFIDRWSPGEADMDISREITGVNYVETVAGYTGQGVRGEILDLGFNMTHVDFGHHPLIEHTAVNSDSHGAACSGICFADGTGNPMGRGILPDGQGIVADWDVVSTGTPRYDHTGELTQPPYEAVFQTSSVGSTRTHFYSTISADTDAALFDFDITHCQSQSNAGDQDSRPQAWAKNIISGGGVNHQNTLDKSDDCWCSGGSIGPATDGRIKPDLSHFYDATFTTTTGSTTSYTSSFGGTSGATPNICGNTGLFYQMWSEGIFGNDFDPGGTVFSNRPHMTLAKAAMINTAEQYAFTGQGHDLTRVHQGWGMPSPRNLWDKRDKMFFVDEVDVLSNLQSASYPIVVTAGEPELKFTMTFADPPGNPAAAQHRINNLDLRVIAPDLTEYWGNVGLLDGNYSTAGGSANDYDTVENVFIENPAEGTWTVEVIATEIVEDGHTETDGVNDADFALVVSGGIFFGFRLNTPANSIAVCSPTDAVFPISVDPAPGFSEPVTFSTSGLPAGTTAMFSTNPVNPPGMSTLTISGVGSLATGDYPFTVTGTSTSITVNRSFQFSVFDGIAVVPSLITPADSATSVSLIPTLNWSADAGTQSYLVQIATDAAFSNIVDSATLTGTSWSVSAPLDSLTTHYWRTQASNACGTSAFSTTYSFTTLDQPLYFTELFPSGFDLENHTTAFELSGNGNFYILCGWESLSFPTDPSGGTDLGLGEDSFATVALNQPFNFYGSDYSTMYVGSNGYITFDSGETEWTETYADHFSHVGISGHFDDYSPQLQGSVTVLQLGDRVAVTWQDVTGYQASNSNNFQIELFHDGRIHITHLSMDEVDGLVGLSNGGGTPGDFIAEDLSAAPAVCEMAAPCDGDANGDLVIDATDLMLLIPDWHFIDTHDVNNDGVIDMLDLVWTMENYGPCP